MPPFYRTYRAVFPGKAAFTLVELLLTISIISMLIGLTLPAVQAARETARRTSCVSNLRQLGFALNGYESAKRHFPASWLPAKPIYDGRTTGWSSQVQLLPFLEHEELYSQIDLQQQYSHVSLPSGERVGSLRIADLLCPSEPGDQSCDGRQQACDSPVNYGANLGVWFVYDPVLERGGEGAFFPQSRLKTKSFRDGLSNTVAFAEVKAWTPYWRNAALFAPEIPAADDVCDLGGQFMENTGHTRWVDGRAQSTGVTATFTPNTKVKCTVNEIEYDIDWNNQCEGLSRDVSTYSAISARSYHPGGVNIVRLDASAEFMSDAIDKTTWRAMFTRRGGDGVSHHWGN